MNKMKVAYLSVQQIEEGFDPLTPVSYAAIQKETYECDPRNILMHPTETGSIQCFMDDEMDLFFECLFDVNMLVVFNRKYIHNILKKYWYGDISKDFVCFDIQDSIAKQIRVRPSINMLGDAIDEPRLVSSGLTYIYLWKSAELAKLRKCINQDILILKRATNLIMGGVHSIPISHPYHDKQYTVDLKGWCAHITRMYKKSFFDRCMVTEKQLKLVAKETNDGLELKYLSDSNVEYLTKLGKVYTYTNKNEDVVVCHPDVRRAYQ